MSDTKQETHAEKSKREMDRVHQRYDSATGPNNPKTSDRSWHPGAQPGPKDRQQRSRWGR
jgi:hypothetical protein